MFIVGDVVAPVVSDLRRPGSDRSESSDHVGPPPSAAPQEEAQLRQMTVQAMRGASPRLSSDELFEMQMMQREAEEEEKKKRRDRRSAARGASMAKEEAVERTAWLKDQTQTLCRAEAPMLPRGGVLTDRLGAYARPFEVALASLSSSSAQRQLRGPRRWGLPIPFPGGSRGEGQKLGSVMDVRVLVYKQLYASRAFYESFCLQPWEEFLSSTLEHGSCGDEAFCDATGFGCKIYKLEPDAGLADLVLRPSMKTPWWTEEPEQMLELAHILEWHYDAVVAAGSGQKRRKKSAAGYDLSGRKPGPGHLRHKYAAEEGQIDQSIKEFFMKTVMSTRAKGSARSRLCGESTAKMHWYALRSYLGFLEAAGHLDDKTGVHPAEALADTTLLKAFYCHDTTTCGRGTLQH
eukprot:Skav208664  [mRNA]  locus=scaffold3341:83034:88080:+ [translate_table: standard]